ERGFGRIGTVRDRELQVVRVCTRDEVRAPEHEALDPFLDAGRAEQAGHDWPASDLADLGVIAPDANDERDSRRARENKSQEPEIQGVARPDDADFFGSDEPEETDGHLGLRE